nr:hypothetical protein [Rhizobium leguminosarum]
MQGIGRVREVKNIFLSASIPLPTEEGEFFETADVLAIREAIKALVEIVVIDGTLTFGGHPAITPLVAFHVRDFDLHAENVTIFQSKFFKDKVPPQVTDFVDVRYTRSVDGDLKQSLSHMRKKMIGSRRFDCAVFIGGMEGIFEELRIFREMHPKARLLPVASTGAAAKKVFDGGKFPKELATELTYPTLFRRLIMRPAP